MKLLKCCSFLIFYFLLCFLPETSGVDQDFSEKLEIDPVREYWKQYNKKEDERLKKQDWLSVLEGVTLIVSRLAYIKQGLKSLDDENTPCSE